MKRKISFFFGLLFCLTLSVLSLLVLFQGVGNLEQSIQYQQQQENQRWVARLLSFEEKKLAEMLDKGSPTPELQRTIDTLFVDDFLLSAKLYNLSGNLLVSKQQDNLSSIPSSLYLSPLIVNKHPLGFLELHYRTYINYPQQKSLQQSFIYLVAQGGILFLFGTALSGFFALGLYFFSARKNKDKERDETLALPCNPKGSGVKYGVFKFLKHSRKISDNKEVTMTKVATVVDVLKERVSVGETVKVQGWIRTRRDSKAGLSFLNIYDGSCFDGIQAIVNKDIENYESDVLRLTTGCSVAVTGVVAASPAAGQAVELQATKVEVVGWVEDPDTYPMAAKRHSVEYLREVAHLRPRTNLIGAVARVRSCLAAAIHRFFQEQGFYWVASPLITASDTEGAGEMFRVSTLDLENLPRNDQGKVDFSEDFFGKEAFLTVSGQLNAETYACALSKVYTFGPTFRAENSNTTRHLAEFWMVEPEFAFANLEDNAKLAETMLKYVFKAVLDERRDDLEFFAQRVDKNVITRLEDFIKSDFAQVDYTDAIDILLASGKTFEFPVSWGIDLSSEHERYLAEEHFKSPVVVKNYPKDIKAFYMRLNDDGKTVAAMDVLAPGIGEIIGGSQREERLNILDNRMQEMGLNPEDYWWYRDLRKYGTVPHSGFGLGFERLVVYVTGVQNIREVIPFPRTPRNANF